MTAGVARQWGDGSVSLQMVVCWVGCAHPHRNLLDDAWHIVSP